MGSPDCSVQPLSPASSCIHVAHASSLPHISPSDIASPFMLCKGQRERSPRISHSLGLFFHSFLWPAVAHFPALDGPTALPLLRHSHFRIDSNI